MVIRLEKVMSERAYSEELKREISAIEAHKKSIERTLKNAKAFHCHDEHCGIKLTCSNWAIKDAKRIYFTPSSRNDLHSIACSTVSGDEEKRQIEIETEEGKKTIRKNGIIAMRKAVNNSKTKNDGENGVKGIDVVTVERRNSVSKDKTGIENRNVSSIKSYINFYYDDEIDNNERNIRVDGEIICLNTLFVDAKEEIPFGVNRIFFGMTKVTTPSFNDKLVAFEFDDVDKPCIYTNKEMLLTRINSRVLNRYLDTEVECNFFFRGCIDNSGKFVSYNGKNYCDVYILE